MSRIGIILGSTRPNRNGEQVARWVLEVASRRHDAYFELLDLRDYPLPHLDEPLPPSFGQYQNQHTKQWAAKIASYDGFVIVTPEYNHGTSGVLKIAIDYLYTEWNNKAVGFVSYGSAGGARAVEHLRLVAAELQMADVRQQVVLSLMAEFENFSVFKPGDYNLPRAEHHARPSRCLEHGARTAARHCWRRSLGTHSAPRGSCSPSNPGRWRSRSLGIKATHDRLPRAGRSAPNHHVRLPLDPQPLRPQRARPLGDGHSSPPLLPGSEGAEPLN